MLGRGISMRRWLGRKAKLDDERGVAMVEYLPLLSVIAFVVFFSFAFLGPWVANHLGVTALSIHYGDHVAGECPEGNWVFGEPSNTKKNGQNVDANQDGRICDKDIPGDPGEGNNGENHNVKDNTRLPWETGG